MARSNPILPHTEANRWLIVSIAADVTYVFIKTNWIKKAVSKKSFATAYKHSFIII